MRVMLLNTWEGGWDSGSSCWEAVLMDLHVGGVGWESESSC